jgi:5-methylcytosine-specific restriction endonuclease McrA
MDRHRNIARQLVEAQISEVAPITSMSPENVKRRERYARNREKYKQLVYTRRARKKQTPQVLRITPSDWRDILAMYENRCADCGATDVPLTKEHIVPLSRGGLDTPENVIPVCRSCNSRKKKRPEEELVSHLKLLGIPKKRSREMLRQMKAQRKGVATVGPWEHRKIARRIINEAAVWGGKRHYWPEFQHALEPHMTLYHASPYGREILKSGSFRTAKQLGRETLGGHGDYVSMTTKKNAREYARALQLYIGFLNGELDWGDLDYVLQVIYGCPKNKIWGAVREVALDDPSLNTDRYKEQGRADVSPKLLWQMLFDQEDAEGRRISKQEDLDRRWKLVGKLSVYCGQAKYELPWLIGTSYDAVRPKHLLRRSMDDVVVLEVAVVGPTQVGPKAYSSMTPDQRARFTGEGGLPTDVTYNPSEKEWRFYETDDLQPVRIIR